MSTFYRLPTGSVSIPGNISRTTRRSPTRWLRCLPAKRTAGSRRSGEPLMSAPAAEYGACAWPNGAGT
jgi:hypothetical protein